MICENCGDEHDGLYASGRFCSQRCAKIFATKPKRKEINQTVSRKLRGKTFWNQKQLDKRRQTLAAKDDFFNPGTRERMHTKSYQKYRQFVSDWLNPDNRVPSFREHYGYIRCYLFEICNGRCESCGWNEINSVTGRCPLDVHHIDGNHDNNELQNLRLLCPNCHSLTDTYKSLKIRKRNAMTRADSL